MQRLLKIMCATNETNREINCGQCTHSNCARVFVVGERCNWQQPKWFLEKIEACTAAIVHKRKSAKLNTTKRKYAPTCIRKKGFFIYIMSYFISSRSTDIGRLSPLSTHLPDLQARPAKSAKFAKFG